MTASLFGIQIRLARCRKKLFSPLIQVCFFIIIEGYEGVLTNKVIFWLAGIIRAISAVTGFSVLGLLSVIDGNEFAFP